MNKHITFFVLYLIFLPLLLQKMNIPAISPAGVWGKEARQLGQKNVRGPQAVWQLYRGQQGQGSQDIMCFLNNSLQGTICVRLWQKW